MENELARNGLESMKERTYINTLCNVAYKNAYNKGFYENEVSKQIPARIALIHSEVSEALEADRVGDKEHFEKELADICIRIFDLCGYEGIDLEGQIIDKMKRNLSRERKHGNKLY